MTGTFDRFLDDAATFPPGSATLPDAVRDHLARRTTALAPLVGPLLLTADRLVAAATLAREASNPIFGDPLRVGLVVAPDGLADAAAFAASPPDRIVITGLEVKTNGDWRAQLARAVRLAAGAPFSVHVELSTEAIGDGALVALGGTRARLKFRTGGLEPHLFPTSATLAGVITTAVRESVPFKLTAGLHRAVRYLDPATGFTHHGFLNIAAATAAARTGAEADDVAALLATGDVGRLIAEYEALAGDSADGWRASFESFGTCSITEPVETLVAVGLLDAHLLDLLPTTSGDDR